MRACFIHFGFYADCIVLRNGISRRLPTARDIIIQGAMSNASAEVGVPKDGASGRQCCCLHRCLQLSSPRYQCKRLETIHLPYGARDAKWYSTACLLRRRCTKGAAGVDHGSSVFYVFELGFAFVWINRCAAGQRLSFNFSALLHSAVASLACNVCHDSWLSQKGASWHCERIRGRALPRAFLSCPAIRMQL